MDTPETEMTSDALPLEAHGSESPSVPNMPVQEALDRITRGELISRVKIERLKLKGNFGQAVRFREVTLVRPRIEKADFAAALTFDRCTLDKPSFSVSTFAKGLSFDGSILIRPELRRLQVAENLTFVNTRFRGKVLIESSKVSGKVRFWNASFQDWVTLQACEIVGDADLRSLHATQGFVINGCQFRSSFLFRGSTVEKKFEADRTRFDALTDFSKVKLHDFVYLESIEQGPDQTFAFTNALAERILVRPEQLEGRIASEKAGDHAQAMQEYGLLKRVFEGLHRYEHEDWAFYRFKVSQRRSKGRSWQRPMSQLACFFDWLLLDHGCGYGTNPRRAVRAALIIVLAFAAIYAWGIESLHVETPPFGGLPTDWRNRAMIGTLTSVAAFTSGFGDIRDAAHGWMNLPLIAESLLGTLLWGLFIVAFSRKVIR